MEKFSKPPLESQSDADSTNFFDIIRSATSFDELEAILKSIDATYRTGPKASHKEIGTLQIERECYTGIHIVETRNSVEIEVEDDDPREFIDPIVHFNLLGAIQCAQDRIAGLDNQTQP